jgi:F-type H+-transporting ATPase subunit gamma
VRGLALLEVRSDIAAGREVQIHPFYDKRPEGAEMLVLVAGDKGLCGAFNSNIIRFAIDWFKARQGKKTYCVVVGRKSRDFVARLKGQDIAIVSELVGVFPKIQFAHAELVGKAVLDAYEKTGVSKVTVLYNEFKSVASQKLVAQTLLPIPEPENVEGEAALPDFGFEPQRQELLAALLPRYVKAQLYRVLLDAMDAASKNAKELRQSLDLEANRTRQAAITKEIAELVGGAEALAS